MMHLDDGQLRAVIDHEAGESFPSSPAGQHLENCPQCQARLAELSDGVSQTGQRLAFLAQPAAEGATAPGLASIPALSRFQRRLSQKKEIPMLKKVFGVHYRAWTAAVLVVAFLIVGLSIPSGRAWAGQFLGLFRVEQVTVIPIDPTGLTSLNNNTTLGEQISQVLADSVSFDQKPGEPQPVASAEEASQAAGFTVRLPESQTGQPKLTVQGGSAFSFTIDRKRAQALLEEAGHNDLVLPESLDHESISVTIPTSVTATYGSCPDVTAEVDTAAKVPANPQDLQARSLKGSADCILMAQIPSPTVNTPPDMDVQKFAETALEFTGMSPEQAQEFSKTVDWTSSLVIPIPKNAASYEQVSVDGVTGTLIQRAAEDVPEYALIWVKDGIIYTIGGYGTDTAKAIEMANTLK